MGSWFPAPRYRYKRLSLFCTHFTIFWLFPGKSEFFGPLFIYCVSYVSDDLLYFSFLFRGSSICQSHIQSNFYYNGHSDSPYIDSLFIFYFIFIFLTGSLLLKSPVFTDWLVANVFYRVFSRDVTAAILLSQNNETAAMLVSQTSPLGVELFSDANAFFCSNKSAQMLATWVKTLYNTCDSVIYLLIYIRL